ncbi:MAG: Ig-like domain-containing protein [Muribaculaceae bacterium]|nr:Ig-like domain-containing protein [Muribaculaceae bacterium]
MPFCLHADETRTSGNLSSPAILRNADTQSAPAFIPVAEVKNAKSEATPENAKKSAAARTFSEEDGILFQIKEDASLIAPCMPGYAVNLSAFLDLDPRLDLEQIYLRGDFEIYWVVQDGNIYASTPYDPGVYTYIIGSYELGKELYMEFEWLPEYPESFYIYTLDENGYFNENTGLELTHLKNNVYTSLITIPEGEDDFNFCFKGQEPYADLYIFSSQDDNGTMNLDAEIVSCSCISMHRGGIWGYVIPKAFRGNTYQFRISAKQGVLEICHEDYERTTLFEWAYEFDCFEAYKNSKFSIYDVANRLIADDTITIDDLIFTFEPQNIEGIEYGDQYIGISKEYNGPNVLTVNVTTAELQEKGISLSKEIHIYPDFPSRWLFVSDNTPVDDLALLPTDNYGIFANTITIPDGEGDFSFRLIAPEQEEVGSDRANLSSYSTADLSTGYFICPVYYGSLDEITIPAEYRGHTLEFSVNLLSYTMTINEPGVDPYELTVIFPDSAPEFASAGATTTWMFTVKGKDLFDYSVEARIDNNDNAEIWGFYDIWNDNQEAEYSLHIGAPESRSGHFTLHIGRIINGEFREYYTRDFEVRYISIESITSPESIVIRQGEFAILDFEQFPAQNSQSVTISFENPEIAKAFIDDEPNILALQPGSTKINLYAVDWQIGCYELKAVTSLTVLPKEASVGEHVFHASIEVGGEMKLKLSGHAGNSAYANDVKWTSSNPEIVAVDNDGNISALEEGVVLITADCGEHQQYIGIISGSGFSDTENASVRIAKVYGQDGIVYVCDATEGSNIHVFDAAGNTLMSAKASGKSDSLKVGKGVRIVSVDGNVYKLAM